MKFLVLTLCVCAASAASFDYKPYQPKQYQSYRQPASAPVVAAKTIYNAAELATAPVAKNTDDAVVISPVVGAKTTYNTAQLSTTPVVAAKATYNAVAVSPVVGAKSAYKVPKAVEVVVNPVYKAAQFGATGPVIAAKAAYDTAHVVPKAVYNNGKEAEASIVRSNSDVTAEGFIYSYETANGIAAQSSGSLKNVNGANVLVSQGSYEYPAPDGTNVKFEYVADENGYQPKSNLLPVAPPVPEPIARALQYILTHPPKTENN